MNTNNSAFSPNRLVFLAGGPEAKAEAPKAPQAGIDSKDARKALQSQVEAQLKKMKDTDPNKSRLETKLTNAKIAEEVGEKEAKQSSVDLLETLGKISGNPALEAQATMARREIQREREFAHKQAQNSAIRNNQSRLDDGQTVTYDFEGKTFKITPHGQGQRAYSITEA